MGIALKYKNDNGMSFSLDNLFSKNIIKMKKELKQCSIDGIENVSPIIILLCDNPEGLKTKLGKSSWKKIHNSSFELNLLRLAILSSSINSFSIPEKYNIIGLVSGMNYDEIFLFFQGNFNFQNSLVEKMNYDYFLANINISKRSVSFFEETQSETWDNINLSLDLTGCFDYIKNIYEMAIHCNEEINWNWSAKRLIRFHDYCSGSYNLDKLGIDRSVKFNLPIYIKKIINKIKFDDCIKVKILCSVEDFDEERKIMRHCIASYCQKSYAGEYVAFHIYDSCANEHSTLGFEFENHVDGMGFKNISVGHNKTKKIECKSILNKEIKSKKTKDSIILIENIINPSKRMLLP